MSVTTTTSRVGPLTIFSLPATLAVSFQFIQGSDLEVLDLGPASAPFSPARVLLLNSDYTVTGGGYNPALDLQPGAVVVVGTGLNTVAVNDRIVIARATADNQPTSFQSTGLLTVPMVEKGLDRRAVVEQEAMTAVGQAIKFPITDSVPAELLLASRKNKLLGFDGSGAVSLQDPIGAPSLTGTVIECTSYSALRAVPVTGLVTGRQATTLGYSSAPDGGEGLWKYDSTSVASDNNGTRLKPTVGPGAFLRCYSGAINGKWFGAKGDGVTDDYAALSAAIAEAAGGALYIPAGTYALSAPLVYNADSLGRIRIFGDGPNSILKPIGATNGALHITGTAGVAGDPVVIQNLLISSATSGTSAFGLWLDGIAHWLVESVWVQGNSKMAKGMRLTAAQQGEISGGQIFGCTVGAYLEDNNGGAIRSNGVDWHGMTFNNTSINLQIASTAGSAGADDIAFHGNHLTSAAMAIDVYAGSGQLVFTSNHIEPNGSNNGIIVRGGSAAFIGNTITGAATDLDILNGTSSCKIIGNLITGNVTFESGAADTVFGMNSTGGTITDSGTRTRNFGNRAFSGTPLPLASLFDAMEITASTSTAAGDILRILANGAIGGHWGFTIVGAGGGKDVYVRFGTTGPIIAGNTSDGDIHVKSGVAGTEWGKFNANGFNSAGGTKPVISTIAAITSGAAAATGTLTNAPVAGNPSKWMPVNDAGVTGYVPMWVP